MATRIGACAYVENSALTKEGVRNVSFPGFTKKSKKNKFRSSKSPPEHRYAPDVKGARRRARDVT